MGEPSQLVLVVCPKDIFTPDPDMPPIPLATKDQHIISS